MIISHKNVCSNCSGQNTPTTEITIYVFSKLFQGWQSSESTRQYPVPPTGNENHDPQFMGPYSIFCPGAPEFLVTPLIGCHGSPCLFFLFASGRIGLFVLDNNPEFSARSISSSFSEWMKLLRLLSPDMVPKTRWHLEKYYLSAICDYMLYSIASIWNIWNHISNFPAVYICMYVLYR